MSPSIFDDFQLTGQRALITGGSRGLGREIALAYADAGAEIVLVGRGEASLQQTAADIAAKGAKANVIVADITLPAECKRAAEEALALPGGVDILVNNVGGRKPNTTIEETNDDEWREGFALNVDHCFLMTRLIGQAMIARGKGGRIINMGSISGMIINQGVAGRHYEAGKAAIIHFTKALAVDWAQYNINANCISPGLFMTEPNQAWTKKAPEAIEKFVSCTPMGRAGIPREIAGLALYLASPASSYVTGSNFVIDGGYTAW
ncbi:SDR family NAD(P)-dependent oxidoreductase [Maritalea mediterranea]|uniref:SDR family oxidoreductase n=1 Tax=Maritalea mediterranea TaxID=2909667 RepID=A0ABS9E5K7_9HYPH|nr:SDR family NAD(P)-dependent oxidoreductase [Maritalea mediterranea]MCF4098150.1 SDR family oxidoreductase [Maritalea mediterranea]